MTYLEGAAAPFSHFPLCSPQQRDDALLKQALEALRTGHQLDALLAVEYVCRRYPAKALPALLRARIVEACQPQLAARAWYQAWTCEPDNPALQDALLACWLRMQALAQVRELGRIFLPMRCQQGNEANLLSLLAQAGLEKAGVCWINQNQLVVRLFQLHGSPQTGLVHISDQNHHFTTTLRVSGGRGSLPRPQQGQVFSVSFDDGELLQGSPLIFPLSCKVSSRPRHGMAKAVDIVVPVYRGLAQVQNCLNSVLRSLSQNATRARLIVIDDASPEPAMRAWLDSLASQNQCILLRNRHNLGFVESVNRGMRHHAKNDVLLLNADTEVHGDWIDRLRQSLYNAPDIGAVTPWSNNGEITSFPKIANPSLPPSAAQLAGLDRIAATLKADFPDVELPACCGFAMMIRRSVLDQTGLLDGAGFYRGYGEEVDWCLRARAAGFRMMLAVNVFVTHTGGVSFGMEKVLRVRQNRALLLARYPGYYPEYHQFIHQDGLMAVRAAFMRKASGSEWLSRAMAQSTHAFLMPQALPSAVRRIAVWQHELTSRHASRVLGLARLVATRPHLNLRLLMLGQVSDALWHTGVVDVIPDVKEGTGLFSDGTLIGLAGCLAVLVEEGTQWMGDLTCFQIDQTFDPAGFLLQFEIDVAEDGSDSMVPDSVNAEFLLVN